MNEGINPDVRKPHVGACKKNLMLNIVTKTRSAMCDRVNRRDFLRVGTLGLGGLALPDLLRASASGGGKNNYLKDKSVVLLFLTGGPSQYETFDPKPDGLEGFRSLNGHIPTALSGVRFASYLPKLAKLADRLSVVRSFKTHHAEHSGACKQFLTADLTAQDGKPTNEPSLTSIYSRAAGAINPATGMFRHAILPPNNRYLKGVSSFSGSFEAAVEGSMPAGLGNSHSPFPFLVKMPDQDPSTGTKKKSDKQEDAVNPLLENLELHLSNDRLTDRQSLLRELDRLNRGLDADGAMEGMDAYGTQALELLRSGSVRKALDLSLEDKKTFASYDTEHFRNWSCNDQFLFERDKPSIGISLGRQMLMARRLCEAGCGFVTVISGNWDFHARKGIPNMPEGMSVLGPPLDHAVSAFLEDVEQRGLSNKILLVVTGEFGRSGLDKNLGRHHHPKICPLVFAGGGLKHGQVIGQSNERGSEPASDPYVIDDFHATMMHYQFDVNQMRLDDSISRVVLDRAQRGRPIAELF